ncbi:MAG: DUF3015 domain-containing protein [Pseudomonadales bacterium]|nr:DUF3015 domain-containing protein [Pseudomonadales bacterium]
MDIKKLLSATAISVMLATTSSISLAENSAPGSGPNPFSDCGIGAALFPTVSWAAVISNVIWDVGTTAVSSATLSPETCNGKNVKTAQFILENYDNLAEETAKGEGDHITAMLGILGCQLPSHGAIVADVRINMATQVGSESYSRIDTLGKASAYYDAVSAASTDNNCSA